MCRVLFEMCIRDSGWSPDLPGVITTGPAKRAWPVSANLSLDGITLSRQYAHSELAKTEGEPATTAELASRATGCLLYTSRCV